MNESVALPGRNGPSWICCQLGAREHYAVPRALKRRGAEVGMMTDIWWKHRGLTDARIFASLRGRFHPELSPEEVIAFTPGSIINRLARRMLRSGWYREQEEINKAFQRLCVSALRKIPEDSTDRVVFAYSYAAADILSYARERGWKTVLGQIDPGPTESRIVIGEYTKLGLPTSRFYMPPAGYWDNWRSETEIADWIVVNSEWSARCLMSEEVAPEKIRVIPCAYEPDPEALSFRRAYPVAYSHERPMNVLFLGQPVIRKGIHLVLEAAERLLGAPVRFTVVGGNTDLPDPRPPANVEWVGQIPRQEASHYYRNADLFLLPTLSDGFALTQLESLSWKLPVLVSRYCGDVITNGRNGLVLEEPSTDSIQNSILALLAAPAELQRMSDAANNPERFGLESVGQRLLGLTGSQPESLK